MSSQTTLATLRITPTQQLRVTASIRDTDQREGVGVDIRKWYLQRGEFHPTQKGIWLNLEQLKQLMIYLVDGTPAATDDIESIINPELIRFLHPVDKGIERLR